VPLATRLTAREIGAALDEAAVSLLVVDGASAPAVDGHRVTVLARRDLAARASGRERVDIPLSPAAAAVAVLTSGTTGRPRAALLSHAGLASSARAWGAALPPATGWLLCLGLSHVAGLGVVWRALRAGVPLRVVTGFDPEPVLAALGDPGGPSHVSVVPVQLARLLDAAGTKPPPPDLRAVLVGGAPVPPDLVRRASAAGWPVIPTYGLTEAGSGVTALSVREAAGSPGSAGRPLPGVAVRIAEPGPDGVGEIQVLSPASFSG
jgi:O-succinylbenzoic acid--CoA ligase